MHLIQAARQLLDDCGMRQMKLVDRIKMLHHRARAESFIDGVKFLADDLATYAATVALLAVHGAISLNDAVLVGCLGKRSNEQDHRAASKLLETLCNDRKADKDGVRHLVWLLSRKTDFAYGDRVILDSEVKSAVTTLQRFQAWVYRTFPEVSREDKPTP
jgi:hypothetical protein